MFGDINEVRVMGNLTRDPEMRSTNSGTSVCNFSIATNRRYEQNGEWKEETEFHNIVLWARRAESFVPRAKKGTRVYVEGRLQTRSWEDQNGSTQYRTEIVASRVILIDRYEKTEGSFNQASDSAGASQAESSNEEKQTKNSSSKKDEKIDPDDLPF